MAGTFTQLLYHMVFSTKHRKAAIVEEIRPRLYDYMGGIVRKDGGVLLEIGGMPDHVHLLVRYHQKRAVADFMRDLKSNSSRWVHEVYPRERSFAWQDGYGAFTVSKSMESTVARYIRRQPEHHREKSFKEEFRALLDSHGLEWDEAYIWD